MRERKLMPKNKAKTAQSGSSTPEAFTAESIAVKKVVIPSSWIAMDNAYFPTASVSSSFSEACSDTHDVFSVLGGGKLELPIARCVALHGRGSAGDSIQDGPKYPKYPNASRHWPIARATGRRERFAHFFLACLSHADIFTKLRS